MASVGEAVKSWREAARVFILLKKLFNIEWGGEKYDILVVVGGTGLQKQLVRPTGRRQNTLTSNIIHFSLPEYLFLFLAFFGCLYKFPQ